MKELRRQLRGMKSMEIREFGKYEVTKLYNKYAFRFKSDVFDECDYIATVGERQAIEWIQRQ